MHPLVSLRRFARRDARELKDTTMRKMLLVGGLALMAVAPSLASAETRCAPREGQRAAGTVLGAIAGGVIGSQLAGRGSRGEGAALGAVGGGIIGNTIASQGGRCPRGYYAVEERGYRYYPDNGYYDRREDYDRNGYYGGGATWRDSYGRLCSWRSRSYADRYGQVQYRWVQDCR
jgi:hypothetical protein